MIKNQRELLPLSDPVSRRYVALKDGTLNYPYHYFKQWEVFDYASHNPVMSNALILCREEKILPIWKNWARQFQSGEAWFAGDFVCVVESIEPVIGIDVLLQELSAESIASILGCKTEVAARISDTYHKLRDDSQIGVIRVSVQENRQCMMPEDLVKWLLKYHRDMPKEFYEHLILVQNEGDEKSEKTKQRNDAIRKAAPRAYQKLRAKYPNRKITKKEVATELSRMDEGKSVTSETIVRFLRTSDYRPTIKMPKKGFA